jgi:cytochrome c-type biogenesis protein CcmH
VRRSLSAGVFLAVTVWLTPAGAAAAELTPQQQVEGQLMCYCGCAGLTVRVCTCGTADGIRDEIRTRLTAGETPDQVVAAYVARHGEKIRSAPTKRGFDLLAWVTPFAALLLAGSALVLLVRRWGRAGAVAAARESPDAPGGPPPPTTEERRLLEKVRREIEETH